MRKLILGMFMSLDGFVSSGTGQEDWIFRSGDDATDGFVIDNLGQAGLIAMGSRSFADMVDYWPTAQTPYAAPMNQIPNLVFSRKTILQGAAPDGSWASPHVASGDLGDEIARLKAQPGKSVRVLGGATLARALVARRLVDEFQLLICPVALGRGVALFGEAAEPLDLKRVSTQAFAGGAVALVYRPD